ncbi:MAG: VanZ family protein, partial [Chloroflexota bacterium]
PNKHVHIPEYVLMVWLLFTVLSRDYVSKDIFVLIFICTTALGVVDELEQGIHPSRFYGLSDMIVNSASGLIGIFTIMGLKKTAAADWRWTAGFKEMRALAILVLLGGAGVAAMVAHLFRVQSAGAFWGIYPAGLWAWTVLFLMLAPVMAWLTWRKLRNRQTMEKTGLAVRLKIIQLWLFPLVGIFFYMNLLLFYVAVSGTEFL